MEGQEKRFGTWLRAGGRRLVAIPANRWLVLDPTPPVIGGAAFGQTSVTEANNGNLMRNEDQLLRSNLPPTISPSSVGIAGVNAPINGIVNEDGNGERVVIVEQKHRRVGEEGDVSGGSNVWSSPMVVEGQNVNESDEVGPSSQAHRAK